MRSTRRHIQEDGILHSHRHENLKSYTTSKRVSFNKNRTNSDYNRFYWREVSEKMVLNMLQVEF
jgi:hypothetical protein